MLGKLNIKPTPQTTPSKLRILSFNQASLRFSLKALAALLIVLLFFSGAIFVAVSKASRERIGNSQSFALVQNAWEASEDAKELAEAVRVAMEEAKAAQKAQLDSERKLEEAEKKAEAAEQLLRETEAKVRQAEARGAEMERVRLEQEVEQARRNNEAAAMMEKQAQRQAEQARLADLEAEGKRKEKERELKEAFEAEQQAVLAAKKAVELEEAQKREKEQREKELVQRRPKGMEQKENAEVKAVKEAFVFAWSQYSEHAFGADEIDPSTGQAKQNWGGQGAQLIDALDTIIIMKLDGPLQQARKHVEKLDFTQISSEQSVFELNIRFIGGLLAAHGLTKDELYLRKAKELANLLLPAFDTPGRFPYTNIVLSSGAHRSGGDQGDDGTLLADAGTLQMEWAYLSHHVGDPRYGNLARDIFTKLEQGQRSNPGFYPVYLSLSGGFRGGKYNWGAMGDSFYEYLLKYWLITGKKDDVVLGMYLDSVKTLKGHMIAAVAVEYPDPAGGGAKVRKNLAFTVQQNPQSLTQDHLACFAPGLLALGAQAFQEKSIGKHHKDPTYMTRAPRTEREKQLMAQAEEDMVLADELLEGCMAGYLYSAKGLSPDVISFPSAPQRPWSYASSATSSTEPRQLGSESEIWGGVVHAYGSLDYWILRPETVESLFVMYRLTHEQKWRDYGWHIFQKIQQWSKTPFGYSGVNRVNQGGSPSGSWDGKMHTFFLAETIKYLYLLFDDSNPVPINQFIFNTEAHPLPVFDYVENPSAAFKAEDLKPHAVISAFQAALLAKQ